MKPDCQTIALDEEFKIGLNNLRPFIVRLSSMEDAKLTRLWLEKLYDSLQNRFLRNEFLCQLTNQVQRGRLEAPFNKPPPASAIKSSMLAKGEMISSDLSAYGKSQVGKPRYFPGLVRRRARRRGQMRNRQLSISTKNSKTTSETALNAFSNSQLQVKNEAMEQMIRWYEESVNKTQQTARNAQKEVSFLKNKLEDMTSLSSFNECRSAMSKSLHDLSSRLDAITLTNRRLKKKCRTLSKGHLTSVFSKSRSETNNVINKLKNELNEERKKRAKESIALKQLLSQKENQLSKIDFHVQHQCDKMQKEVSSLKREFEQNYTSPPVPKINEKILDLRKHVHNVEKINKKILAAFEKKLYQCREEYDNKMNRLQCQVEGKDKQIASLEAVLKSSESKYKKQVEDLHESCRAQRIFDHQRIASLEQRLRQHLFN